MHDKTGQMMDNKTSNTTVESSTGYCNSKVNNTNINVKTLSPSVLSQSVVSDNEPSDDDDDQFDDQEAWSVDQVSDGNLFSDTELQEPHTYKVQDRLSKSYPFHEPTFPFDKDFMDRLDQTNCENTSVDDLKRIYKEELQIPVGARLARFWPRWKALGADSVILNKIRYGLELDWIDELPPLTADPPITSDTRSKFLNKHLTETIETMLTKRAIREVSNNSLGFYSRLFMVPKKGSNKLRPVIDLSTLNTYVSIPHFKMETAELIRASLTSGEWISSIDLADAYFHVPINKKFRKYFRFAFRQKRYEFLATPFGLGTAPLEFTGIAKQVNKFAMELGFRVNQYLDDWINRCLSYLEGKISILKLLHLVLFLGLVPNFGKCELEPAQEFDFVGYHYDLVNDKVRPTDDRILSLERATTSFRAAEHKSARQFMSFIGLLNSTFLQVQDIGRLHIRPLQWHLRRNWNSEDPLHKRIRVPSFLDRHLKWWANRNILMKGSPLHPPKFDLQIFTDASHSGWGAHCAGVEVQGQWQGEDCTRHINVLEMKAVLLAMDHFASSIRNKVVIILCDNATTVWHLKKAGGLRVWELYALTWRIYAKAQRLGVTIQIRHIPGSLNVIADRLSRKGQIQQTEWSLHPEIFKLICKVLYRPMIDGFATAENTKLPIYISPIPDEKAYAVDALSTPWHNLSLYLFPPTRILSEVVRKLRAEPCTALLLTPFWPAQVWFWDLVHISTDRPRELPIRDDLLKQPGGHKVFDKHVGFRNLHVWTIDTSSPIDRNFTPSKWLRDFELRRHIPPAKYCKDNNFEGSFKQCMSFWLDTHPL